MKKQKRRWNDLIPRSFNYTNPTMCRMLKVTQFFSKGPFIIDGSGWAGKNEGWVTSNSRQSEGGGGGHQEICTQRGGATCFFILFYFPIAPLGLTGIDGLQASKKGQQFMATNDMSQYYVQNEIGVVTVQLVPCLPRIVLVPEELPVLQCTTTRSSWQSLPSTELLDSLSDIFFTSCSCLEVFAWFLNLFVGFVGFYRSPCLLVRV